MAGFNRPSTRNGIVAAAHRRGLNVLRMRGELWLCRFGQRVPIYTTQDRWWFKTDASTDTSHGPFESEEDLAAEVSRFLEDAAAHRRRSLARRE